MLEYIFMEKLNDQLHLKKQIGANPVDKKSLRGFWRGIRSDCSGRNNRLFKEVELDGQSLSVFAEIFESELLIMILVSGKVGIKSKVWLCFEKCKNLYEQRGSMSKEQSFDLIIETIQTALKESSMEKTAVQLEEVNKLVQERVTKEHQKVQELQQMAIKIDQI